ncbi:MAG: RNA polymerase factor sigma-32 [Holosporaceae bacterium]|jgi:RNA polymerase sigma-32 factor|nr:RNA polymerase factor sigma-32 [Holosporaceae bacterium]
MAEKFRNFYNDETLSTYVSEIKKFPLLGDDEEFELATKWKEKGDKSALDKIVKSHLRLVIKIAQGYAGYGLPKADLISEGNIGIMCALQHFDPSIGYRFSTYAAWWIKAKIRDFIYNSWSIVKLGATKNNRKLFFNLRKTKNALGIDKLSEENADFVADKLNVSKEEVLISENRFTKKDFSTNITVGEDGESSFQDFIADHKSSQENIALEKQEYEYRKKILHDALNTLSKREHDVVCAYRLHTPPKTLREIAGEMSLSAERVRQIDSIAFLKIQKYVRSVEWNANAKSHMKSFFTNQLWF